MKITVHYSLKEKTTILNDFFINHFFSAQRHSLLVSATAHELCLQQRGGSCSQHLMGRTRKPFNPHVLLAIHKSTEAW